MTAQPVAADLVEQFRALAERAGCSVYRLSRSQLLHAAGWASITGWGNPSEAALADSLAGAYPDVSAMLARQGAVRTADVTRVAHSSIGISAAALAVAETGSLLMVGHELSDRLAWLLPPHAVILVAQTSVVSSLSEAMVWLSAHRNVGAATFVTGPSRTSDVERVLTIGVQGPRLVSIILVTESEG